MGKVLRVLVVLIALLAIAACVFAYKNYSKREALAGRAHMLEDSIVKITANFEAVELPDVPAPSYAARDTSPVTSREVENPERSAFWDSYNGKLEAAGQTPPMLNYGTPDMRLQLRQYYQVGDDGKYVNDPLTGKPATEGEGTMDELLKRAIERAKSQYNNLIVTRAELTKIRTELVDTIEELNKQKQDGRADKREIDSLNAKVSELNTNLRAKEAELESTKESLAEANQQVEDLNDKVAGMEEEMTQLNDKVKEQEQLIRELRGKNDKIIDTTTAQVAEGVLTPGVKGKVVACNDEWKYAVVEFTPEFITELIGPQRDRALPQVEVMVKRADIEDPDAAFVTRLQLRQVLRDKNVVIADVLADWQQKPVQKGDIVFY